jgi:hypothetical protein
MCRRCSNSFLTTGRIAFRCPIALESWVVLEPGGFMPFHDTRRLRDFANVAWILKSFCEEVETVYCNQGEKREYRLNDPEREAMHSEAAGRSTLVAKTAWYKMIENGTFRRRQRRAAERHFMIVTWMRQGLDTVPAEPDWCAPYLRWRQHAHLVRPSWYEWDCQRMWREDGPEKFASLDLWEVPERTTAPLEDPSLTSAVSV